MKRSRKKTDNKIENKTENKNRDAKHRKTSKKMTGKRQVMTKPAHAEAVVRLRRVRGHLDKVIQMVEDGSACTDILQQLSAVLSALGGCRTLLFSGHLKTCLRPALKGGNELLIDEIEKLASRVMKVN